jgi:quinol monooxygenase YgiN
MNRAHALVFIASCALVGCGAPAATTEHGAGVRYAQLPEDAYAVVADIRAKPGKEDELRKATLPLVTQVRNEPNNRLYFLHEDREAPGHFVFYEIFASRADFEAHNATPHVTAWFAGLPDLADGSVKVMRLQLLGNQNVSSK